MYDTITKDAVPANYDSSVPTPCDENMKLLQKQADEATTMAKEAKRTSLLSASMLFGSAVLFIVGVVFSSSSITPEEAPLLGLSHTAGVPKEEIEAFCKFESSNTLDHDFPSQPCAHCFILGKRWRMEEKLENGEADFASCYLNQITATGRGPTHEDFTLRPYDENDGACDGWVVAWYEDLTNYDLDDTFTTGDKGWSKRMARVLNNYYLNFLMDCEVAGETWGMEW